GSNDVSSISAYNGNISFDGRVGAGIGVTEQSIAITEAGRNFGADTSQAVANTDGSFTYQNVMLTGGSGSGASADIRVKDGAVVGVSLVSVGGGYQVGDTLTAARAQLGDLTGRTAAERDAWALRLQVRALANVEGLEVRDALDVTFGERVYMDGDITIQASGKVVFSDAVVLRNGGQLIIQGAQEVVFYKGIEFSANAQGQTGALLITANNGSVSFLSGMFAGQNDAMSWSGIARLELQSPQQSTQLGSLSVAGVNVVLSEAPGFANLNLNLDALNLDTQKLTMPASSDVSVNMNLGLLDMKAAQGIGAENAFLKVNAQQINAQTDSGSIFMEITGSKPVALDATTLTQGDVNLRVTTLDTLSVQVLAQGKIDVAGLGSLTLTPGSRLESKAGSIRVTAVDDLVASGTTLISDVAQLEAGKAINAVNSASAPAVSISGDLQLKAVSGIGDFGYGRFLINNLNSAASVSALNTTSGDVVLAGVNGLNISEAGVISNASGDAWVGLLSGSGAIVEQGPVVANSKQVMRLTGVTWMPRPSVSQMATMAEDSQTLVDILRGGVQLGAAQGLEQFNRLMAQSFTSNTPAQSGEYRELGSATAMTKVLPVSKSLLSPSAARGLNLGMVSSPQSTTQLLEMAMAVVQQNPSSQASDTESLGSWASRTPPATGRVDAAPALVTPQPVPSAPPSATDERTDPAEPTPPNNNERTVPAEPAPTPNSGVQWLLPDEEVAAWAEAFTQPAVLNPA
ncbi:MAG: hypothetical protein ACO27R_11270, partial [Hylemonella sp.]